MNLNNFFNPKTIAVIGVSRNPNKVGHVIFKNLIESGFPGEVIPINPETQQILHYRCYPSIAKVKKKIDLAVIAIPAEYVLKAVQQCNSRNIKDVVIVTAGFRESGNAALEDRLKTYLNKNKMRCIGVNCLGHFDAYSKVDTLFLPRYRLKRPAAGNISFVCQSGAVGSAILDIATEQGHKFSKFISYGNATNLDESDIIEYLAQDKTTKVICLYVEGIQDGEKFFRIAKRVSKTKPIIAIKGGLTAAGSKATLSHTGALAGNKAVYLGIFRQTGIIKADSLEEMFNIASLIEKGVKLQGNKILVITNGGGYGIIATDTISDSPHLKMAELSPSSVACFKKSFPPTASNHNPLDLVGDATTDRYKIALETTLKDKNIDAILLIVLYQTPLITTDIVEVISELHREYPKPLIVVSTGAEFTKNLSHALEENSIPVFQFPEDAIKAIDKLTWYESKRKTL